MSSKKILRLAGTAEVDETLCGSAPCNSLLMNQQVYQDYMKDYPVPSSKEIQEYKNHPVTVSAFRIDWLIDSFKGQQMLESIQQCKN